MGYDPEPKSIALEVLVPCEADHKKLVLIKNIRLKVKGLFHLILYTIYS